MRAVMKTLLLPRAPHCHYYAEFQGGKNYTCNKNRVRAQVQRVQGLDRHVERIATLTPASCALLLLLLFVVAPVVAAAFAMLTTLGSGHDVSQI